MNTHAFQHALRRAGIANFRWHVQAGTSLYELQELGGWSSAEMVRRYAHFSPEEHLLRAAARVSLAGATGTKVATATIDSPKEALS